jgi:hypothetical protein
VLGALYLPEFDQTWLRFVDGRPLSAIITTQFLSFLSFLSFLWWCSKKLGSMGKKVGVLVWENASWHIKAMKLADGSRSITQGSQEERQRREDHKDHKDHKVLFAQAEPLAEADRAQVGAWQA